MSVIVALFSFLAAIGLYVIKGGPLRHDVRSLADSMTSLKESMDGLSNTLAAQTEHNEHVEHRLARVEDRGDGIESRLREVEIKQARHHPE